MNNKLDSITVDLWAFLTREGAIEAPKLYQKFKKRGEKDSEVKNAIKLLEEFSLIKFMEGEDSKGPLIKRRKILGEEIEFFPCLGCQALEKCGVGENYSPENCEKLSFWLKKLEERET